MDARVWTPEQETAIALFRKGMQEAEAQHEAATRPAIVVYYGGKSVLLKEREDAVAVISRVEAEIKRIAAERNRVNDPHDKLWGEQAQAAVAALNKAGVNRSDLKEA